MTFTTGEAFSLRPIGSIQLGEETYAIPPLTFGRFQSLLGVDFVTLQSKLTEGAGVMSNAATMDQKTFGAFLVDFNHVAFWPAVLAVMPDVPEGAWKEYGRLWHVLEIHYRFFKSHDWASIGSAINWGKESTGDPGPTAMELTGALLKFSAAHPAYSVADLLNTRVEGFYQLVTSLDTESNVPGPEIPFDQFRMPGQEAPAMDGLAHVKMSN